MWIQVVGGSPLRSRRSQARACVHLPSIVLTDTPKCSATSGTDRPEKNLSVTISAPRESIASRRVSAASRARRSSTGTAAVLDAISKSSSSTCGRRPPTVARSAGAVHTTGGLRVLPHFDFAGAPPIHLLVIPGGFGTRPLIDNLEVREWIQKAVSKAQVTMSVCTGALLLAKAGLLADRRATTHWGAHDLLASLNSKIVVERHLRVVDDGIVTSAGVAAGIDMALSVVESLHGKAVADETAKYMEFPRHSLQMTPIANADRAIIAKADDGEIR